MVLFYLHFKSMADTGPRQYGSRKLETPERNFLYKVGLQYFWTPCMWYNLSSFIRCIPFTIHSCLESLVSSGSVLDYYGYNALIGLTINLFYFSIMKASINNSDFLGKYYWKYFIYKCYTKKGFLGIFFRLLCEIYPKHLYKMYFIPDDACKAYTLMTFLSCVFTHSYHPLN